MYIHLDKMQFNSFISLLFVLQLNLLRLLTECAPLDGVDLENSEKLKRVDDIHGDGQVDAEKKKGDYYEYKYVVATGVQKALDECREKFKWDRWNCPKKVFKDVFERNSLPSNKELGLTRALVASGIVLALTRTCSYGTDNVCGCSNPNALTPRAAVGANLPPNPIEEHLLSSQRSPFIWSGCDESVKFAFKVSKAYLESQDIQQDDASRRINAHNYEAGRLAVKKNMKRMCKCHGVSGSCQVKSCWNSIPDMSKVGDYLKRQYRLAAKVGAMSAEETNIASLNKELAAIRQEKLVFADASPDYCYENPKLGINGTLGRYCSKPKHRADGTEMSRNERDSCDRLCTKCGYKIKKEILNVEKQCECRFVYCCSVECKRCPIEEETYRCVRHS